MSKKERTIKASDLQRGGTSNRKPVKRTKVIGAITTKRYLPIDTPIYFMFIRIKKIIHPHRERNTILKT
jgi:hypothetical protein